MCDLLILKHILRSRSFDLPAVKLPNVSHFLMEGPAGDPWPWVSITSIQRLVSCRRSLPTMIDIGSEWLFRETHKAPTWRISCFAIDTSTFDLSHAQAEDPTKWLIDHLFMNSGESMKIMKARRKRMLWERFGIIQIVTSTPWGTFILRGKLQSAWLHEAGERFACWIFGRKKQGPEECARESLRNQKNDCLHSYRSMVLENSWYLLLIWLAPINCNPNLFRKDFPRMDDQRRGKQSMEKQFAGEECPHNRMDIHGRCNCIKNIHRVAMWSWFRRHIVVYITARR